MHTNGWPRAALRSLSILQAIALVATNSISILHNQFSFSLSSKYLKLEFSWALWYCIFILHQASSARMFKSIIIILPIIMTSCLIKYSITLYPSVEDYLSTLIVKVRNKNMRPYKQALDNFRRAQHGSIEESTESSCCEIEILSQRLTDLHFTSFFNRVFVKCRLQNSMKNLAANWDVNHQTERIKEQLRTTSIGW